MPAPIPIRGAQAELAVPRPRFDGDDAQSGVDLASQHHGGRSRAHSFAFSGDHQRAPDQSAGPPPSSSFIGYLSSFGSPRREMNWTAPSSEASGPHTPPSVDDHAHHDEHKDTFGCETLFLGRSMLRSGRRSSWSASTCFICGADTAAPSPAEAVAAPSTSPTTGISGWLSQQRTSAQADVPATSPIGLFRRLSIGSPPPSFKPPFGPATATPSVQPAPVEQPAPMVQTDAVEAGERGRFFRRSPSTSKRKLSPMSERMLRASEAGHF